MRKLIGLFCALLLLISPAGTLNAWAAEKDFEELDLKSQTAVLMDLDTGQVLYNKDMNRRVYPASTTKVLTALVVLENANPDEIVTVHQTALEDITWDSSHIALTDGEQFTVDNGLYALMLPSANDAANALAEHVAGSQETFAEMLNERAREIGALHTHFTNAHGLHDDNHYTTAYDMALITRAAMENEMFRVYFGAARYTMPATNKNEERPFTNYQYQLVKETGYYDPRVVGGKIGYTEEAQHTMTTVAKYGDRTLICTVMGSPKRGDKFDDTEKLLDFGFGEFSSYSIPRENFSGLQVPVMDGEQVVGSATFYADSDVPVLLYNSLSPEDISITFPKPQVFTVNSPMECRVTIAAPSISDVIPTVLREVDLVADVNLSVVSAMSQKVEDQPSSPLAMENRTVKRVVLAAVGLICLIGLLFAYREYKIRKKRKARLNRLAQKRREAEQRATYQYYSLPSRSSSGTGRTKIG